MLPAKRQRGVTLRALRTSQHILALLRGASPAPRYHCRLRRNHPLLTPPPVASIRDAARTTTTPPVVPYK